MDLIKKFKELFSKSPNLPPEIVSILRNEGVLGPIIEKKDVNGKNVYYINARELKDSSGFQRYSDAQCDLLETLLVFDDTKSHVKVDLSPDKKHKQVGYLNMLGRIVPDPKLDVAGREFWALRTGKKGLSQFLEDDLERGKNNSAAMVYLNDELLRDAINTFYLAEFSAFDHANWLNGVASYDDCLSANAEKYKEFKAAVADALRQEKELAVKNMKDERAANAEEYGESETEAKKTVAAKNVKKAFGINRDWQADAVKESTEKDIENCKQAVDEVLEEMRKDLEAHRENLDTIYNVSGLINTVLDEYKKLNKGAPDLKKLKSLVSAYMKNNKSSTYDDKRFKNILKDVFEKIDQNKEKEM